MMEAWWTKTSAARSRTMKPKPLVSLNHFTVPCSGILLLLATNETGLLFLPPGNLSWSLDRKQEKNPRGKNWCPRPPAPFMHVYEIRPRKDKRGVSLISDALPFGRLWYGEPNAISNAVDYAKFYSRSHKAVIRVFDELGNVIETHEHAGEFKEW